MHQKLPTPLWADGGKDRSAKKDRVTRRWGGASDVSRELPKPGLFGKHLPERHLNRSNKNRISKNQRQQTNPDQVPCVVHEFPGPLVPWSSFRSSARVAVLWSKSARVATFPDAPGPSWSLNTEGSDPKGCLEGSRVHHILPMILRIPG